MSCLLSLLESTFFLFRGVEFCLFALFLSLSLFFLKKILSQIDLNRFFSILFLFMAVIQALAVEVAIRTTPTIQSQYLRSTKHQTTARRRHRMTNQLMIVSQEQT